MTNQTNLPPMHSSPSTTQPLTSANASGLDVPLQPKSLTSQKCAEEALHEQTALLQSILDSIGEGVAVADAQGRLIRCNPAARRLLGMEIVDVPVDIPPEQWFATFGLFLPDAVTPVPVNEYPLIRAVRGETVTEALLFVRNAVRSEGCWLSVTATPLVDASGTPTGGVAVFRDVTQQREAQQALCEEQRYLEHLLHAHERDRKLTAFEIHDGIVQDIAGSLMRLEVLRDDHPELSGKSRGDLVETLALLRKAIEEGRRLIGGLRPPVIDELGVVAAVQYLIGERKDPEGLEIEFVHDGDLDRLNPLMEATLFRIAQEAITNIRNHSQAEKARVSLSQTEGRIQLQVQDWGRGFNPDSVVENRFGLRGIRERARLLGGKARIESAPGKGTRIAVDLPLSYNLP
jgi:signal transduction histidine kinase